MNSMQVKDKVRNIANKKNVDFNNVFRLYMYDRFIERQCVSRYKDETGEKLYKFIGVYSLDKDLTRESNKKSWKKIDDKIDLTKYFK